jgi:hypothetical protein
MMLSVGYREMVMTSCTTIRICPFGGLEVLESHGAAKSVLTAALSTKLDVTAAASGN